MIKLNSINIKDYSNEKTQLDVKYGLPSKIEFCKKCTISNQRPSSTVEFNHSKVSKKSTIDFNKNGICAACLFAEKKLKSIDWQIREEELQSLCNQHRKDNGEYDCIVPGSGGKDSVYASHILKYKYKMNPLTVTWAPNLYTDWGWKNFQSWIHAGFDNKLITPNGRVHRLLTRLSLENLFHPFQAFMLGQKNIAPRISEMLNIPLIFYGENESEYGNPVKDNNTAIRNSKYYTKNDTEIFIGGTSKSDLIENFGLTENDLHFYLPLNQQNTTNNQPEVHYLGYYLPWHPQGAYYYAVENAGFQAAPERTPGTYSKYNSIDDKIDDFHYYTTFIKFGIGRATYDSAQEIRNNEITREEGIALVEKYDGEFPKRFSQEIFDYLSIKEKEFPIAYKNFDNPIMSLDYFNELTNTFRSPHIWKYDNKWTLRTSIYNQNI